jgi:hypothetical protein
VQGLRNRLLQKVQIVARRRHLRLAAPQLHACMRSGQFMSRLLWLQGRPCVLLRSAPPAVQLHLQGAAATAVPGEVIQSNRTQVAALAVAL